MKLSASVHAVRPGSVLVSVCGRRLSRTLRTSILPQAITCRGCIDGLGIDSPERRMLRAFAKKKVLTV